MAVKLKRRSVALLIETSNAYARGLMDGVVAYQRQHARWSIYMGEHERRASPPLWLREWKGDGIIARIENEAVAEKVRRLNVPTVDVSAARLIGNIPCVETDDKEIADQGARHLASRGFRSLAFCGDRSFLWSNAREDQFAAVCKELGLECSLFMAKSVHDDDYSSTQERDRLRKWLKKLSKPVGVMACYDFRGQQILDICREIAVAVPEQVSVVGVDNDERLCSICTPPLSSVIPDAYGAGYKAAELLDQIMNGEAVTSEVYRMPPLGIAERRSSDIFAIDDEDIIAAERYIREHACEGIAIADILKAVPLSRRALEYRFRKLLHRTPHQEIIRIRIERVKALLRETDLPLAAIAMRAGFAHADYLSVAFKKVTGVPPSAYRKQNSKVASY
ncbi:Xylose operon regulatory protein [Posidoniimonas polymericola]|uniref:Xylose operon regulatory protein n=1 Tax=Posidoniimonas polymericola TaxID=2528002 RepID=A0A5C5XUF3_9BACT|nr:DNA-binding transcriptional regulator [Posidoniimonas polymericola]TWT66867.1 Xylose operon regulatory protein [Posidoniimonas polymericola]